MKEDLLDNNLHWKVISFNEFTVDELYDLMQLRSQIFVVEQDCVYNDLDGLDRQALHVLCYNQEMLIGYARLLPANTRYANTSIGRVVIHPDWRGKAIGKQLIESSIQYIQETWVTKEINISAQQHLEAFYSDLGFITISDVYMEDGIPHVKMEYRLIDN